MTHERVAVLQLSCNTCGVVLGYMDDYEIDGSIDEIDSWCSRCFMQNLSEQ